MNLTRRPDIERFLAAPPAGARGAVIHGRDLGLVRERAGRLAAAVAADPDDPFDVAMITEADMAADRGRLEGELAALSMLGGRRLVRLRLAGDGAERDAAEALKRHLAGELNPDAFFLVESPALRGDSALLKAAKDDAACAAIACYEDEPGDLARLTREALAAERLTLEGRAIETFVGRLPADRGVARQEIERLVLFLGPGAPGVIGPEALEPFLGVEPEASLGEAALHAFGGRLAQVQAHLRRAALEGEAGIPAVRALGAHLARLRRSADLRAAGDSPQGAAKAAGVFWKIEREFIRQSGVWTRTALEAPEAEILATDLACKRAGAPDRLLAERLAFSIAGQARRLGL